MECFELYIQTDFAAAHFLRGYKGDCSNMHGHNWVVEVFVRCKRLNDIGIGIDFREIKQSVKSIIKSLDHTNLSEHPAFETENPTSENMAKFIYKQVSKLMNSNDISISRVKVSETATAGAYYWEE